MAAGRTEAAFAAGRFVEFVDFFEGRLRNRRQHQLRYAVAAGDGEIVGAMVDQDDFQFVCVTFRQEGFNT